MNFIKIKFMFEDRLKQVLKNNSLIEKKENVIAYKKLRLEEMLKNKLVALFKNKFNTDFIVVKFPDEEKKTHYRDYGVAPSVEIKYTGYYNFNITRDVKISGISSWSGFSDDDKSQWNNYLSFMGQVASILDSKKPLYSFLVSKFNELNDLYEDLKKFKEESKEYDNKTKELIRNNKKGIISDMVEAGMRFEFGGASFGRVYGITRLDITEKKPSTYLCSVYGFKQEKYGASTMRWYDVYVKHDDLHSTILNNQDGWCVEFKRKFNLEITIQ